MAYAVGIVGLAQLRRDLRAVDRRFDSQIGDANYRAAKVVADEATRRAPRGPHQGGGKVAPISSTITALRRRNAATVAIGGARSPHAVVTEFGGSVPRRGSDPEARRRAQRRHQPFVKHGVRVTHVRKQAYLYPAIDAKTSEVLLVFSGAIGDLMGEAFNQ